MKQYLHLLLVLFLVGSAGLYAQQGIGTNTPNDNAALEIDSPDKGVLIPRISLVSSSTLFTGVTADATHNGMLVYNTSTATNTGLQGEGVYQWRLPRSGGTTYYWFKMLTSEDSITSGTVTNSTLRWNGQNWVENDHFMTAATQATLTADLFVDTGSTTLTLNDNGLDLNTAGSVLVSATSMIVTGTTTFHSTVTLNNNLVDSSGSAGEVGEILSATATGTLWINPHAATIQTLTAASSTPSVTTRIILLEPAANMTLNIPTVADYPTGFNLKIRRNQAYSSTSSNTIVIDPDGTETIDGHATRNMNVGWQSLTLINTGTNWVSID